jgi:ribosomal protein S18 acetylase RimI-like enzyme
MAKPAPIAAAEHASAPTSAAPLPGAIRTSRPSDAAALMALEITCFPEDERFPLRTWRHLLGPAAAHGSAVTQVVPAGDGIGAAISTLYRQGSSVARIYSLAVDPAQRGRGLAKALIEAAAAAARKRGCTAQSLEVRSDNDAATGLYLKFGFVPVETLRHYYARGRHGTRYRRSLG